MTQPTSSGTSPWRGRRRRNRPGGLTVGSDGEQLGRDYVVRYATSAYQNGTMVLRFPTPPGRRDLIDAIADYGVAPASIEEIDASPVPALTDRSAPRAAPQRPPVQRSPGRSTPETSSPRGPGASPTISSGNSGKGVGRLLGIVIGVFLVLSLLNVGAFDHGRWTGSYYSGDDRAGYCTDSIGLLAPAEQGFFQQLVSDDPTSFPVTPPNTAYLLGCLSAG